MYKNKIEQLLDRCLKNKKTLTPSRIQIFKTLAKYSKPQSAYDLKDAVNKKRDTSLNISTIYRVLDFWIELGAIHKISSINKYIVCLKPNEKHTHMLNYCTRCEKVFESCTKEMNLDFKASAAKLDLVFNNTKTIEIPVICPSCN